MKPFTTPHPPSTQPLPAGAAYHVSPNATGEGDGSEEKPFATLEAARDAIRNLASQGPLPDGGITVKLGEGIYRIEKSFALSEQDSGTVGAPIVYQGCGARATILTGGLSLRAEDFVPVTNPNVLAKIPEAARGNVLQADLNSFGITRPGNMPLSGHGMEFLETVTSYRTGVPAIELFCDGEALPLSRWPDDGYAQVKDVVAIGSIPRLWQDDMIGKTATLAREDWGYIPPEKRENPPQGFAITIEENRARRWTSARDAMLFGYWFFNWSDQAVQLAGVDEQGVIRSVQPSAYGVAPGQRFYVYNLIEELDAPGEWFLDRHTGILYLLPPEGGLEGRTIELSLLADPIVRMNDVSHVAFEGLGFSASRGRGIAISGGKSNLVRNCAFRQLALNAISIEGGFDHAVVECLIEATGAGGLVFSGGDRQTLFPAGHRAENNTIRNFARLVKTYSPAIDLHGVGHCAVANRISHGPHVGIRFAGNNHLIEDNEISHVCLEADDMGAIYAGRDVTARGTVIRGNRIRDLAPSAGLSNALGRHGVYLDDQFCGTCIEHNVFHNIGGLNVVINGGRDNVVANNTFIMDPELAPEVGGLARFAAVAISNIGMDPRVIRPDGRPPMPDSIPFDSPVYAGYRNLAAILSDEPPKPKYNRVEGNQCCGLPAVYFDIFKDTDVSEAQMLEWNHVANNPVLQP